MGYERNPRGANPQDQGRDYGSGRDYGYSSARDYDAAGAFDRDRDDDRRPYGQRDERGAGYYGRQQGRGYGTYGGDQPYGQSRHAQGDEYHGSYASDGRRWEDVGPRRHWDDDNYDRGRGTGREAYGRSSLRERGGYGDQPKGYDQDDRGFLARAGDEVRSWFGDEDAERRREQDNRYDERAYNDRDQDYHSWRSGQIAAFDRDYHEYRSENRSKFHNEFSTWRSQRQTQRDSLDNVQEHDEVVGSDGSHVGTVDKVRGDRILLTKNDVDAGGQHHSIPSRWIRTVEAKKVTLSKTADEARQHWRTEEKNQALFGDGKDDQQGGSSSPASAQAGPRTLNRSFSGTY